MIGELLFEKVITPLTSEVKNFIVNSFQKIWHGLFDNKCLEEISEKDKFNEQDVSNVIDYNKLLNDIKNKIEDNVNKIEQKIILECIEYYEELLLLVEDIEKEKNMRLQSGRLKRNIEKIKRNTTGSLSQMICREISLDNVELKKILGLPSGELKKNRIEEFKDNLMKQALEDFISEIKLFIKDFSDDISYELNGAIADITKGNETLLNEFNKIENSKKNDTKNINTLMEKVQQKVLFCEKIIDAVKE